MLRSIIIHAFTQIQDLDSEVQLLIGKARMIKAERDRAKRKADEDKKKEEEKAKKEKKDKKKKKKEKDNAESEKEDEAKSDTEEPPGTLAKYFTTNIPSYPCAPLSELLTILAPWPSLHCVSRVLGSLASNCQILGHLETQAGVADEVEDDHVSEELIELVPGLIWAVVETGQGEAGLSSSSENLVMAPSPEQPSPSFLETMFILILIHLLFEFIR